LEAPRLELMRIRAVAAPPLIDAWRARENGFCVRLILSPRCQRWTRVSNGKPNGKANWAPRAGAPRDPASAKPYTASDLEMTKRQRTRERACEFGFGLLRSSERLLPET